MKNEHPLSLTKHADRRLDLDKCSTQADELGSADTVILLMITTVSAVYERPHLMQSRSLEHISGRSISTAKSEMPRFTKKPHNNRNRKRFETNKPRLYQEFSDEVTSIYVRNLPASADKQSLHDWCQRTVYRYLDIDGHQRDCGGIIKDIWIAKPVSIKSDTGIDGKPQKLRYAHIRFQHGYFRRLMVKHARPEELDGVSKPEVSSSHFHAKIHGTKCADLIHCQIQKWKPKAARHNETKSGHGDGDLGEKATITSSKEASISSPEAVESAVE